MSFLSQTDIDNLQSKLDSLRDSIFVGALIGAGSIILDFSNGSTILVQCPFEVHHLGVSCMGHGESPDTSMPLFSLLNRYVSDATVNANGETTLQFGTEGSIRMISDHSGFEAYVLKTPKGVLPVY